MSIVNLLLALALMGGLWTLTIRVLAASLRHSTPRPAGPGSAVDRSAVEDPWG